jgi:hypothetical protein
MFLRERRRAVALLGLVALLGVGACGEDDDDGGAVRETGPGAGGSGSASASGTGSASGSASASGTASGAAIPECVYVGSSAETPTGVVVATLTEFSVAPDPAEVAAGTIEVVAHNEGAEAHEIVVVRYDGDPADMPVADDGSVDEEQLPEGAVIGEIEGFAGGQTCATAFDLEPGSYVLLCNIVEEEESGEMEAHYHEGMYTACSRRGLNPPGPSDV